MPSWMASRARTRGSPGRWKVESALADIGLSRRRGDRVGWFIVLESTRGTNRAGMLCSGVRSRPASHSRRTHLYRVALVGTPRCSANAAFAFSVLSVRWLENGRGTNPFEVFGLLLGMSSFEFSMSGNVTIPNGGLLAVKFGLSRPVDRRAPAVSDDMT